MGVQVPGWLEPYPHSLAGKASITQWLRDSEPDMGTVDCEAFNPLHYAAGCGNLAVIKALLPHPKFEWMRQSLCTTETPLSRFESFLADLPGPVDAGVAKCMRDALATPAVRSAAAFLSCYDTAKGTPAGEKASIVGILPPELVKAIGMLVVTRGKLPKTGLRLGLIGGGAADADRARGEDEDEDEDEPSFKLYRNVSCYRNVR